jgi:hypothetical protein
MLGKTVVVGDSDTKSPRVRCSGVMGNARHGATTWTNLRSSQILGSDPVAQQDRTPHHPQRPQDNRLESVACLVEQIIVAVSAV